MATRPSLDDLATKPDEELTLRDIVNGMRDLKLTLEQRLTSIEMRLNEIDKVKGDIKTLRDDFEVTKAHVGALAAAECPFPPDLSLIVSNLPGEENEDQASLLQTVESLVHEGLELTDIEVQAVERTAPRTYAEATVGEESQDERPGVVKVKLGSLQQKIECLRNKRKLKTKSVYKKVYVRGCEDHASRVARLNMDTLLRELDLKGSFRFTGSGKMIKKDNTDDLNQNAGRNAQDRGRDGDVTRRVTRLQSSDTRGRGSSRGNGNRGGRGGRGAH